MCEFAKMFSPKYAEKGAAVGPTRTPIQEVIQDIFIRILDLPNVDISPYVRTLGEQLIVDSYVLSRLQLGLIERLALPVALESELKLLIAAEKAKILASIPGHPPLTRGESKHANTAHSSLGTSLDEPKVRGRARSRQRVGTIVSGTAPDSSASSILGLTGEQIRLIKDSWRQILNGKDANSSEGETRLTKFFGDFYSIFLDKDALSRKLFEGAPMQKQAESLMKMIRFLIRGLDNPIQIIAPVQKLGVRHLIYGAEPKNYQAMAVSLTQAIENALGGACTQAIKESWYLLCQTLSDVMTKEYPNIKAGSVCQIYYRDRGVKWKNYTAFMNHEKLALYRDSSRKKIKAEWHLTKLDSMDIIDDAMERFGAPTPHCFSVLVDSSIAHYFCVAHEDELLDWANDLSERISAHQRLNRYSDAYYSAGSSSDEEGASFGGSGSSELIIAKKKAQALQRAVGKKSNPSSSSTSR